VQNVPCANCGQMLDDTRTSCPACGAPVAKPGGQASAPQAPPPPSPTAWPSYQGGDRPSPPLQAATSAVRTPPSWWKRPNAIIPTLFGVGCAIVLLALTLPALLQSTLSPQEIYERNAGSVVEITATLPGQTDVFGLTDSEEVLGTGFVVSKDGYLLTNAHVVSSGGQVAQGVTVTFRDGPRLRGVVIGADESTDVAVIRVDPDSVPSLVPIPLGDSSDVRVGEQVVAIGNPLGLDLSLSSGVVSATDRDLDSPNGAVISGGIQTDAAINPGNSGGPLIDSRGRVIGINEQIDTQSGGNEGIGFAVPINTAVRVLREMTEQR
jgi:S1-C subfamily serine protease